MKICRQCDTRYEAAGWQCPSCNYEPDSRLGHYVFDPEADQNFGFNQASFARLFEVEAGNFWFRSRNKLIIWTIAHYFKEAKSFLEIGCGTGYVLAGIEKVFPDLTLAGNDISNTGLSFAARRLENAAMYQFDARAIPFEREFDLVGIFDVLEHIDEEKAVIGETNKALAKGGGLIITVPQHRFLWSRADEAACHKRRYSAAELKEVVSAGGFEVVRVSSFVSLLFPLMVISRLLKRKEKPGEEDHSEMLLPGFVNYTFEKVLDFERLMIKKGLNLPFGGSLLLVARKV